MKTIKPRSSSQSKHKEDLEDIAMFNFPGNESFECEIEMRWEASWVDYDYQNNCNILSFSFSSQSPDPAELAILEPETPNPFNQLTDTELEEYRKEVQRKAGGQTDGKCIATKSYPSH